MQRTHPPTIHLLIYYNELSFYTSAYHGHLMSLIDISPYKFRKLAGQKEWVHVVCKFIQPSLHKLLTNSRPPAHLKECVSSS